jgi:carboxyl-terminal processing protease
MSWWSLIVVTMLCVAGLREPQEGVPGWPPLAPEAVFDRVLELVDQHVYVAELSAERWQELVGDHRAGAASAAHLGELTERLERLLSGLGTSHTAFFSHEQPRAYQLAALFGWDEDRLASVFPRGELAYPGVGWRLVQSDGVTYLSEVHEGSPAHAAGLTAGTRIDSLGDRRVVGDQLVGGGSVMALFGVHLGRPLLVTGSRAGEPGHALGSVVPRLIDPSQLFHTALAESLELVERDGRRLGYVHMWSAAGQAYQDQLEAALFGEGPLAEADGLVLDLRGGWGGADPRLLSLFDRDVPLLEMIDREGERRPLVRSWARPVVLLVDGETTSGKEVFAFAFQRSGRGPLVGERTAGAVLAGRAFPIPGAGVLYLPVNDVRVDGQRLEGVGVQPDIAVPAAVRPSGDRDVQKRAALDVLLELTLSTSDPEDDSGR